MADRTSPFVPRSVDCPVCRKKHVQRKFRNQIFIPGDQESDQHVLAYKWKSSVIRKVHPPYYALYYCPYCFFTDVADDFCHPEQNNAISWICRTFWRQPDEVQHTIEFLGRHLDYENITFCSALNLHYLAACIQQIPPAEIRDEYKMGRLYLRLAWLFRERDSGMELPGNSAVCSEEPFFGYGSYGLFSNDLKRFWPEAPQDEMSAMRAAARHFETAVSKDSRFDNPQNYALAMKLVLDLLKRLGDLNEAYRLVRGIYATGMDQRREIQEKLTVNGLPESGKREAQKHMNAVNQYLGDAAEEREDLLDAMVERDGPRLKELLQQHPGITPDSLQQLLTDNGILPEVLRRLKQHQEPVTAKK